MLQKLAAKCKELGCVKGETADQFRARDPQGAAALAAFITANKAALGSGIAAKVA